MSNNNLADISMFESLQANQHAQTGISQMAVFNDLNTLKSLVTKTIDADKKFDAAQAYFLKLDRINSPRREESKIMDAERVSDKAADEFNAICKTMRAQAITERARIIKDKDDKEKDAYNAIIKPLIAAGYSGFDLIK
ncbi:MAG: hypothetical protein LBK82_05225 [Planctomycetaceae bacterium]|nr:hypothetical protein [Planctomycetaceae bacterium]